MEGIGTGSTAWKPASSRRWQVLFVCVSLLHVILALPILDHIVTWCDPGWYSYLSFDILFGRPIPSNLNGAELLGVASDTSYAFFGWNMMGSLVWNVALAGAMWLFGPSYFVIHVFVLLWSLLFIWACYGVVLEWSRDRVLASQAGIVLSLDYHVFWMGTMARPDIMAGALAFGGIFCALRWQRRRSGTMLAAALVCWMLAVGSHPLAILPVGAYLLSCLTEGVWSGIVAGFRGVAARLWPLGVAALLLLTWVLVWYYLFMSIEGGGVGRWEEYRIVSSLNAEILEKIISTYINRYSIGLLVYICISLVWCIAILKQNKNEVCARVLLFLVCLFLCGVALDHTAGRERLLFYLPVFAVACVLFARFLWVRFPYSWARGTVVLLLVGCLLLPRTGKVWQIASNWQHTSYSNFTHFVREHVPRGAVVVGDASLMFGLSEYGLKIVEPWIVQERRRHRLPVSVLSSVEYAIISDTEAALKPWGFSREEFHALFGNRLQKIAEHRGKGAYGYHVDILRVTPETPEDPVR